MGKPSARMFGHVLADITKTGNQTMKTVREKNTSFKCFCIKCKTLPAFTTQTVVILPEVGSGTTSPSLPKKAPSYAKA
jgi:hypothetical protein